MNLIKLRLDTVKNDYKVLELMQGYTYDFEFSVETNAVKSDLNGVLPSLELLRSDKTFIIQTDNMSVNGNKVSGRINKSFTGLDGLCKLQLVLIKDEAIFGSWVVECRVKPSAINQDAKQFGNEVTLIEELKENVLLAQLENEETRELIESGGASSKGDIAEVNSRIDETNKQLLPNSYEGTIVTFVDDDCYNSVSKWLAIANEKGIKISFGATQDYIGTNGYLSLQQVKELQNQGHDILNHTKSHINNWNVSDEIIETEIKSMKDYMKQNGLKCSDVVIYPGNVPNDNRKKNIVRKLAKYGMSNTYELNKDVIDNLYLYRVDSDFRTLTQMKTIVDQFESNKQWLIILTHSWRAEGDTGSTGTFSTEKIKQLIDYIQGKNIPILKFSEAEKLKGISMSVGDYNNDNSVYISKDGKSKSPDKNIYISTSFATTNYFDLPLTRFEKNKIEYKMIQNQFAGSAPTPNLGGVLIVYRFNDDNFGWEEYKEYNSNKVWRRTWSIGGSWGSWELS